MRSILVHLTLLGLLLDEVDGFCVLRSSRVRKCRQGYLPLPFLDHVGIDEASLVGESQNAPALLLSSPTSLMLRRYGKDDTESCGSDGNFVTSSSGLGGFVFPGGTILLPFVMSLGLVFAPISKPAPAYAVADCSKDCLKNCKLLAPNDKSGYCETNCKEYCDQPDRTDGLSGSVSSEGGEVGILGQGTVVKGSDKPPSLNLPGLDFTKSEAGRKLIGY